MKNKDFLKVAIRQNAIFVSQNVESKSEITETTAQLISKLAKMGFGVSEELLHKINGALPNQQLEILELLSEILGLNKNWTPLVKNWDIPTNESRIDHVITFFANIFKFENGTRLQCGHLIPENTFPLERYNGCPFCGTPFEFGEIEKMGQNSKLKILNLWSEDEIENHLKGLLSSKTALDATQIDSLKLLLKHIEIPEMEIKMKETSMIVIQSLIEDNRQNEVQQFFKTPTDILRYLWFEKTGFVQIIEPKTIVQRMEKNSRNFHFILDESEKAKVSAKEFLKLKFSRKQGLMVANWLNNLPMEPAKICENLHPKRGMWVRFIRALRLTEFAKREGFEKLKEILDLFYNQKYEVWQGKVNHFRLKKNSDETFKLLKERPGLFARSLFANMLWFGSETTIKNFLEIIDKLPARLVFTLNMYAENYFDANSDRSVKPLGGTNKRIPANPLLKLYDNETLNAMKKQVEALSLEAMKRRFANEKTESKSIFIHPQLFNMPLSIGDRSENIQDLPSALMGTKFEVEGNSVRLFMQWGKDLPKQHLDMDLSCHIAFENKSEVCTYYQLTATGAKHSGDMRYIPNLIGTAEYIELDLEKLQNKGAKFVTFTCNAYSNGSISPNLVVGWMNAEFPMHISEKSGVAYDPSCVQHQVRVTKGLQKGMVFGVLDVEKREITWLEMAFQGQNIQSLDFKVVEALLKKLQSKLSVGNLLTIKAEAQNLTMKDDENADEVYDMKWVTDVAKVTELFLD